MLCLDKDDKIIIENVVVADGFFTRLKGLLFRDSLNESEGLLITPCNSVHMFFMKFALDIIFLDKDNNIVGLNKNLKPFQCSKIYFKADSVLEVPIHTIDKYNLNLGDNLKFLKKQC